jgi:hypothetical protein
LLKLITQEPDATAVTVVPERLQIPTLEAFRVQVALPVPLPPEKERVLVVLPPVIVIERCVAAGTNVLWDALAIVMVTESTASR